MKTLIIGVGNEVLGDDAAGIVIARLLYEKVKSEDIDFQEACLAGWRCIDFLKGYDKIIIIDALYDKNKPVGVCCKIDIPSHIPLNVQSSHSTGFFEALELARQSGAVSLDKIALYGIIARNIFEFSEQISQELSEKIPGIVDEIIQEEAMSVVSI